MSIIVTTDENTILFIPQFTFDDDAITIPFKNVESFDSAILSEVIAPFVFEPRLDSLSFADAIALSVDLNLFDFATVTDSFDSITFEQFDSASIADAIGPIFISGPHEHLYVGEAVNAALNVNDDGTLQEETQIGPLVEDTISVSEFINQIAFAKTDEIQATDLLITLSTFVETFDLDNTFAEYDEFVVADPPGFDHMHWNDEFDYQFIATTLSSLDDPVLSEDIPDIGIPVVDSINVFEFINLSLVGADQILSTDQLTSLTINATSNDQFIYQEEFELIADVNSSELLSVTDTSLLTVSAVGTQSITFGESVSITVSVADSGNLTETIRNSLNNSDSLNLTEKKALSLVASELSILSDFAFNSASVSKKDTASLSEGNNQIALAVKQISHLLEVPFYHADYARLDYVFLISEIASASILKEADDSAIVTDLIPNILLNGYQLMTFKEKVGIGKAAPIVFNINENPTVHGSVTGDIIIISTGGTEPVLL